MIYLTQKEREHKESFLANYSRRLVALYRKRNSLTDYYWRILDRALGPGMTVLDLGAGEKGMVSLFRSRNITLVGLDMCFEDLKKNKTLDHRVCGDAQNLPFRSQSFDFVLSQWLLEHLPHPQKFFAEAKRVMKSRGRLSVVSNSLYCPFMVFNAILPAAIRDRIKRRLLPKEVDEDTFPTYYRANTRAALARIARKNGMKEKAFIYASDLSFFIFNRAIFTLWILVDLVTDLPLLSGIRMHFIGLYEK